MMTVQECNFGFWIELLETRRGRLNSESFKIADNAVILTMKEYMSKSSCCRRIYGSGMRVRAYPCGSHLRS